MFPRPSLKSLTRLLLLAMVALATSVGSADAAVSYVGTSQNSGSWAFASPGSVALARPAGVVAGDVLILTLQSSGSNFYSTSDPTNQSPAWTLVRTDGAMSTYRVVVPAGNPASYTIVSWFFGEVGSVVAVLSAFRGVDTTNPVQSHAGATGSGTAVTAPSSAVYTTGAMRYSAVSTSSNPNTTWGTLTQIANYRPSDSVGTAYDNTPESPPSTPTTAATLSASTAWGAHTLVLRPPAAAPTVTAVSPSSGPTAGGTSVVITGTDFTGATSVTFGGTAATGVTVNNDGQITATAPARAAGSADVRVTTPLGTSANTAADDYTYIAPPTVTSVSPNGGPTAGGTSVTITGTNFTGLSGAAAVTVGGTNATSYTVDSATQITATVPARAAGSADVRVTTPGGTSANTAADNYTYYAAPTVTALAPSIGPEAGGTSVTITGTNFVGVSGASAVTFGGTNASSYTVNSATSITATAPAGTGVADVQVTAYGGVSANTAADNYTYYAIPTVTSISPTSGPAAGGTSVTITGTNFAGLSGAAAVQFGGTNATSYVVNNSTTITATAPAGTGTQDVRVTTPGGTTANTAADDYTYIPLPTVTNLSPSAGPTAGGTTVTITGTNFTGATIVTFGGTNATGYTVNNSTTITATAPARAAGAADVRVTTGGGISANTAADDYTYHSIPTITSISPMSGPEAGGTSVTITGTNFGGLSGASAVTFGGTDATSYVVNNSTTITATAPSGTGTQDVRVTTPGGATANTAADDYTYVPLPTVTNVSPGSGPTAGGTSVTITGTNLTGATSVTFGGTNATGYTIVNATTITATAPARAAGSADVRVTTVGGTSANTAADDYVYFAAPTITSISPMSGPAPGGTSITITGTNLSGATAVNFGATPASGYSVVNATTITATAPPGSGTVDVRVTTPGGTSANTAADDFTYIPPPTVSALSPTAGPTGGTNTVTITGSNFTGATAVDFGGNAATGFTVVNGNTITATAPAGSAGTVSVRVTTPSGTSANTAADDYEYMAAPTVTNVSPSSGPNAGGTSVTITGTNFTGLSGAAAVRFGATNATSYTVNSATSITATAPAGTGTQDVRVTTPGGTSANTGADDYTYFAVPTITSMSPMSGPAPGGTSITITGTNLSGATAVNFGATPATGYSVVNATTITATAPPGTGTVDVRVTTPGGTTANTAADDFTYVPAPTVVSLSPTSGPAGGGNTVTITGTTFTGTTQVTFDGIDAVSFNVVNATTITATAPAHAAGAADVRVTTPSGTSANTAADDYTYIAAPTVTNLSPATGPSAGATSVTITGTGFTGTTQVTFGGTNATGYTVVNATTITATAPAHASGSADVRVTAPGGTSANTAADDYLYVDPPTVSSIAPSSGPAAGGTVITITGSFFTSATQVQFGGTNATSFTVVNPTTITATAPAGSGVVNVRVTTPDGTSANTAADDFTYIALPTVTGLLPSAGPEIGGTTVTITGTAFTGATAVTFGGVSALGYTVLNATTITATAPSHAAGFTDVRVTTPGGTSANTAADDYEYLAACGLGSLAMSASDFSFTPLTMNGLDRVSSTTTTVGVSDMTAPGLGWKLEIGTTQFTAGPGRFLPASAARITSASANPLGGNCSVPTNSVNTFPLPLPLSPSKVKVYNSAVGTGLGPVDVTLGVDLDVPANVQAGTYTSTFTIDLTAAP